MIVFYFILAFQQIKNRRKSLELERAKFFSDILQQSAYSFSQIDKTHSVIQKEARECLDRVLTAQAGQLFQHQASNLQQTSLKENIVQVILKNIIKISQVSFKAIFRTIIDTFI